MYPENCRGTTLAELMVALVIASIIAIGFSSVLMYTRNMYNDTVIRSQLSHDALIIDQYIRKKLTIQIADSLQIFASKSDEQSGIASTSGIILRAVRPDSTVDHISVESNELVWKIDSVAQNPVDSQISSILFTSYNGYSKKMLTLNIGLQAQDDNLEIEWGIAIRN